MAQGSAAQGSIHIFADGVNQPLQGSAAVEGGANATLPGYVGRQLRIHGLTSATGLTINGRVGTCEGFDPFPIGRLHIRIPGHAKVFKVKYQNILSPEIHAEEPSDISELDLGAASSIDRDYILRVAATRFGGKSAREHLHEHAAAERPDMKHRARRLLSVLAELDAGKTEPPKLGCGEVGEAALRDPDPFVRNMLKVKPPCLGNGKFSLHELGLGGASDSKAACRLAEYPLSGFCTKCQIAYMESQGL